MDWFSHNLNFKSLSALGYQLLNFFIVTRRDRLSSTLLFILEGLLVDWVASQVVKVGKTASIAVTLSSLDRLNLFQAVFECYMPLDPESTFSTLLLVVFQSQCESFSFKLFLCFSDKLFPSFEAIPQSFKLFLSSTYFSSLVVGFLIPLFRVLSLLFKLKQLPLYHLILGLKVLLHVTLLLLKVCLNQRFKTAYTTIR